MRLFIAALLVTLGTQEWAECGKREFTCYPDVGLVAGNL